MLLGWMGRDGLRVGLVGSGTWEYAVGVGGVECYIVVLADGENCRLAMASLLSNVARCQHDVDLQTFSPWCGEALLLFDVLDLFIGKRIARSRSLTEYVRKLPL